MRWLAAIHHWLWGTKGQLAPIEVEVARVARGTRKEMTRRESKVQAEAIRGTQIDLLSRELWPAIIGSDATLLEETDPFYHTHPQHRGHNVYKVEIDTDTTDDFVYLRDVDLKTVSQRMNEAGEWDDLRIETDWEEGQLTLKPGQTLRLYFVCRKA